MTTLEQILQVSRLSKAELGRRMGLGRTSIANAVARDGGVTLGWLQQAAKAAGVRLEIKVKRCKVPTGQSAE